MCKTITVDGEQKGVRGGKCGKPTSYGRTNLLGNESSFVPGNKSSRELLFPGAKAPGNLRSLECKFSVGTFAPRSENTEEQKVPEPFIDDRE